MSGKVSKKSSKTSSSNAQETNNTSTVDVVESVVNSSEETPLKPQSKKATKQTKVVAETETVVTETVSKPAKKSSKKVVAPVGSETTETPAETEESKPAKKAAKPKATKVSKVSKAPAAKVAETADDEELLPKPKKVVVEKPELVVKSAKSSSRAGKVAAKSPAKKSPRSPAKKSPRSPAKKTAKKSPKKTAKSPRTNKKATAKSPAKKAGGRRVANKKGKKGGKTKENKPRREHNLKPTVIDESGIGIGPARVKKVLVHDALNPLEHRVRMEIRKAENKPVRPKPSQEDSNPAMPPQGPQTHIENLNPRVLEVIRRAEAAHFQSLNDDYERHVLKEMEKNDPDRRADYDAKRKVASADKSTFNLKQFNLSFDKNFYGGFAAYCTEHDSYQLGRKSKNAKTGVEREKYNEWSRAAALVNKLGIRLSTETRTILACYLDNLVIQYARNGIHNCIKEGLSIVQLRHALAPSDGFEDRVPLDSFARTLDGYQLAINWLEVCREVREEIRKHKAEGDEVNGEPPAYPEPSNQTEDFQGYVVEICRSVRIQMASEQKVATIKQAYLSTSISKPFKKFCSIIVYEAIKRVGSILKEAVSLTGVKTVSDQLMYHALRQIHNVCGVDFAPVAADMEVRLARFKKWRSDRRQARKDKKDKENDDDDEDEDEDEEKDDHPEPDATADGEAEENEEEAEAEEEEDADENEAEAEEEADENEAEAETEDAPAAENADEAETEEVEEEVEVDYDE